MVKKEKTSKKKRLVLLDAHAIIHRAYHALPDFASSRGEPTGGLYGLASMLIRIINDLKPDYLAACYDLPEPTFRKQIYEGYKSGRAKADEALVAQLIRSRDIFTAFNIPLYEQAGFEADDILGTIVERLYPRSDLKGAQGPTSGSVQVVIASGDMDTLQLVDDDRVLVYTLKRGLSDTVTYDEKKVKERFGFGPELLPDFKGLSGDPSDNIIGVPGIGEKTATILISKFGTIEEIYRKLKKNKKLFERAGIKERVIKLLLAHEEEALFSKTLATIRRDAKIKFELPERPWRENFDFTKIEKLFSELEFRTLGARVKAAVGTTTPASGTPSLGKEGDGGGEVSPELKIAAWLLNSELTNPTADEIKETKEQLLTKLKERKLTRVYEDIELPLIPILRAAEARGILVDREKLTALAREYHRELEKLEKKIFTLVGGEFNLNSPKQLGEVLFDRLGLAAKGLKKTAGGARSTRESELLKLRDAHPAIAEILRYRERQKLVSTYLDAIPKLLDENNRLHTKLHQTGTTTGRMSSSDPNLQNIPADETHGDRLRAAFIATPGHRWLAFDYSQIEMRVLALLSGDPELGRIFRAGEDVHTAVAMKVFRVKADAVTREMRRRAKVINFGIIYGMGVGALQKNLGGSRSEAQEFHDQYFTAFPKIHDYFERVKREAREKGYTETYFGRRRYFPGLKSKLPYLAAMNERMALNAPLQGTAADIVKLAMIKVAEKLKAENLTSRVHLLLQVHDELIYEAAEEIVAAAAPLIKTTMETVIDNVVPFTVSSAVGRNWAEAK